MLTPAALIDALQTAKLLEGFKLQAQGPSFDNCHMLATIALGDFAPVALVMDTMLEATKG